MNIWLASMLMVTATTSLAVESDQKQTNQAVNQSANEVVVIGERLQLPSEKASGYAIHRSSTATKMDIPLRETPQSISIITRDQMEDFKLDNINQVLADTTGVTVEKVETDRVYYTARGFDITNFQFDGIGAPVVFGHQFGDLDTALYDRVEVVRGANGLISSTGNPSATVNFIRKRPVYDFQASAGLSYGSWSTRRITADVSNALNEVGTVAGRVVVVGQTGNSYLDRYQPAKTVFYGVVEANLNDDTVLTVGHSHQQNDSKGAMWGGLPMYYSNGVPTNLGVGASTSADWSYWDSREQRTFGELTHYFSNDWLWKTTLGYNQLGSDGKLLYVYGTPDINTGLGLFSDPSLYNSTNRQSLFDSYMNGKFALAGRQLDFTFGVGWSRSTLNDISHDGRGKGTPLAPGEAFDGSYPEPIFDVSTAGSSYTDRRQNVYIGSRFNLADNLKLLVGANYVHASSDGMASGVSHQINAAAITPYAGLVVDLSKDLSAYFSYSEIFNPQYQRDFNGALLAPLQGKHMEAGLKRTFFSQKLIATAAVFKVNQNNAAEFAGYNDTIPYYRAIDAYSQGVEFELAGELNKHWQANVGLAAMTIKNNEGNSARTYVPKSLLHITATYQLPQLEQLKIGASFHWQGKTSYEQTPTITTVQDGYGLLNLMAHYDINKNLRLHVNLNNVTNQKYISSLNWSQMFYGAPFNGSISLDWNF